MSRTTITLRELGVLRALATAWTPFPDLHGRWEGPRKSLHDALYKLEKRGLAERQADASYPKGVAWRRTEAATPVLDDATRVRRRK